MTDHPKNSTANHGLQATAIIINPRPSENALIQQPMLFAARARDAYRWQQPDALSTYHGPYHRA
jgi:hypothetical protein